MNGSFCLSGHWSHLKDKEQMDPRGPCSWRRGTWSTALTHCQFSCVPRINKMFGQAVDEHLYTGKAIPDHASLSLSRPLITRLSASHTFGLVSSLFQCERLIDGSPGQSWGLQHSSRCTDGRCGFKTQTFQPHLQFPKVYLYMSQRWEETLRTGAREWVS